VEPQAAEETTKDEEEEEIDVQKQSEKKEQSEEEEHKAGMEDENIEEGSKLLNEIEASKKGKEGDNLKESQKFNIKINKLKLNIIEMIEKSVVDTKQNSSCKAVEAGGGGEESMPDYYTLLCLHVETFKISSSPDISLSQVGVTTALNNSGHTKEELLLPVRPAELATTLASYKLEGDLLRALHMTEAEGGELEFRAAFTTREEGEEPLLCLQEEAALTRLAAFIARFEHVVLLTIDSADTALVLAKLARVPGGAAAVARVARVATWGSTLEACWRLLGPRYDRAQDLEDFYTGHCGEVSGYVSALHVANFLRKAVKRLCLHYFRTPAAAAQPNKLVARNAFIRALSSAAGPLPEEPGTVQAGPLAAEVASSFRPAVSSRIGMEAMDTVDLSTGSEVYTPDILEVQRVKRKVRHVVEELARSEEEEEEEVNRRRMRRTVMPPRKRVRVFPPPRKPYPCSSCSQSFEWLEYLENHIRSNHRAQGVSKRPLASKVNQDAIIISSGEEEEEEEEDSQDRLSASSPDQLHGY